MNVYQRLENLNRLVVELRERYAALRFAVRLIVDRWESGDMEEAVRYAATLTQETNDRDD